MYSPQFYASKGVKAFVRVYFMFAWLQSASYISLEAGNLTGSSCVASLFAYKAWTFWFKTVKKKNIACEVCKHHFNLQKNSTELEKQ